MGLFNVFKKNEPSKQVDKNKEVKKDNVKIINIETNNTKSQSKTTNSRLDSEILNTISSFNNKHTSKIQRYEKKLVIKRYKNPTHPDIRIKDVKESIQAYHDLKAFCYQTKEGVLYFSQMWQHCHNSRNPDFDFLETLESHLTYLEREYDYLLEKFERETKQYNQTISKAPDLNKHIAKGYSYVRVHDRISIYANETDSYISPLGQKCVEYEESIIEGVNYYKDGICPYCKKQMEMPKMKKSCPHCDQKVYVRDGGIGQGKVAMTEEQFSTLKKLKNAFYEDRQFNPNYSEGIVVDGPKVPSKK